MKSRPPRRLVLVTYLNPRWLRIFSELASQGLADVFLDVDDFNFPRKRPAGWLFVRRSYEVVPRFIRLRSSYAKSLEARRSSKIKDMHHYLSSEFYSYFKDPNPRGFLANYFLMRYGRRLREFEQLLECHLKGNYDEILVPNGRTGVQRVAIATAEKLGIRIRYLETGVGDNLVGDRFFLEEYPFHNRIASQKDCLDQQTDPRDDLALAKKWLSRRTTPGSPVNKFSRGWETSFERGQSVETNVFFNSSTDEYWALGKEWREHQWIDQYEAFDQIMSKLEVIDPISENVLRLHPNMLNKGARHVRDEISRLSLLRANHPRLRIVWPNEQINSYALVESAKRVIVSMSTLGLEASLMKKPVWCVLPNHYDHVADVRRIWGSGDLSDDDLEPWSVKEIHAARVISFIEKRGKPYQFTSRRSVRLATRIQYFPYQDVIFRLLASIETYLSKVRTARTINLAAKIWIRQSHKFQ